MIRPLRVSIASMAALLAVALLSCESDPVGPFEGVDDDTLGIVVSEPVPLAAMAAPAAGQESLGAPPAPVAGAEGVSYVSYPPGSIPEGDTLVVSNPGRSAVSWAPIVDGGVDPIGIAASVGDTLQITIQLQGQPVSSTSRVVPRKSPPRVVRTRPRRRQARVPLNSSIEVIFTEPIDLTSVHAGSVRLLGPAPVSATLVSVLYGSGVEIIPDGLLQPSTVHTIAVSGIRDLSGESLAEPFSSQFTSAADGAALTSSIVFESRRGARGEIWFMGADGSDPIQLIGAVDGGQATAPALSPDGRTVAFSVSPLVGEWDIYVIGVDGTGLTNLTSHPAFDGWRPAWSPDGSRISFFSTRDDPVNDEIYVMNADGTGVTRLTDHPADDAMSTWSPDGTRIAFETNRDGNFDIYVMNADGTDPRPLTRHPADDEWPAWSPDGTRIAFDSGRDGNREIYVMNADGSNVVRLTGHPGFDSAPAWSPDGTRIAFSSDRGGSADIWIMNADGSDAVRLTAHPAADLFPSWSP